MPSDRSSRRISHALEGFAPAIGSWRRAGDSFAGGLSPVFFLVVSSITETFINKHILLAVWTKKPF